MNAGWISSVSVVSVGVMPIPVKRPRCQHGRRTAVSQHALNIRSRLGSPQKQIGECGEKPADTAPAVTTCWPVARRQSLLAAQHDVDELLHFGSVRVKVVLAYRVHRR